MNPLASNRLDGETVASKDVEPVDIFIVLPGAPPGVVPNVVPNDVPGVVSTVDADALLGVESGVVPKDVLVLRVVWVSLADVVVSGHVVGGNVGGGGSSHLSQIKNPILLLGPSVGSF